MEGPAALKPGELYLFHSGAPTETQYIAGARGAAGDGRTRASPSWASAPSRPKRATRNPRREPRTTENLIAAYEQALVRAGRPPSANSSRSTPT